MLGKAGASSASTWVLVEEGGDREEGEEKVEEDGD